MKKVISLLFSLLLLTACSQEHRDEPPVQTTSLQVSAGFVGDTPRAMDYTLQGTKIKFSLEGKTEVPVYTYIYQGESLVYNQRLQWKVRENKKGIYYNDPINYTADDTGKPLRLVAVIADGTGFDSPNDYRLDMNAMVGVISSSDPTRLNVPYVLEAELGRDISGMFQTKTSTPATFKPQGVLLRCTVVNKSKHSVTVDRIASSDLIPHATSLNALEKTFRRTEHVGRQVITLPKELTIAGGQSSAEQILVWLPSIPREKFKLEALTKADDPILLSSDTKLTHQGAYVSGKAYQADLELYRTPIPNPLALLSEDVVNREATQFVDLRNNFSIDDLTSYNGKGKVGYFTAARAEELFKASKPFPGTSGVKWHLPTKHEWNAILYTPRNSNKTYGGLGSGYTAVQSGKGYKKTVYYSTYVPYNYSSTEGGVFYVLSFIRAVGGSVVDGFPLETTNDNRFAFRYDVRKDRIILTCVYVGDDPSITSAINFTLQKNLALFSRADAVTRILPFYGISNETSGENNKDNTGGNRTIVDYRAVGKWVGAFSIANNAVLELDNLANAWLPIALFRDAD